MEIIKKIKRSVISFALLILVWELYIVLGNVNTSLFPSPYKTLQAFTQLWTSGLSGSFSNDTLWTHILVSLGRFFQGYVIACIVGVILGVILGIFPKAFNYINPIIQILRPIAPVAWLPFIVLAIGIGDKGAVVIIFIAGFFPILLSTIRAITNIDKVYLKVSSNFGMTPFQSITKIILPECFVEILSSLHLAVGTCWIFLVSGEMAGCQTGLGFLLNDAKNCIRSDALVCVMLVIGIIGFILDIALSLLEKVIKTHFGYGLKG